MTIVLQASPLLRARQMAAGADTTLADTAAADTTLTVAERIMGDSTFVRLSPDRIGLFFEELQAGLLDPILWMNLLGLLVQILLIVALAWIAISVVDKVTDRWKRRFEELPPVHPRRQRAFTISNLLSSTARYIIWPLAIITILSEIQIDVGALIATAGIAGLAIGFGAQTLVKDVISGIFLLFDDTIHVGDIVRVGSDQGTVEYIGVRLLKVRKFDGELMMVPAGELRIFGNKSITFMRVIVNVGLSYEQDLETILPVMERVANEWAADRKEILLEEKPLVQAITDFAESSVNVRVVVQVVPGEQFAAERELRILLKRAFDELGIEIPFPRRTLYMREDKNPPPRSIYDPQAVEEVEGEGSD